MTKTKIFFALFLAVMSLDQTTAQQKEEHLIIKTDYLVSLPHTYGFSPDKKWPVLIFLHGGRKNASLELTKQDFVPVFADGNKGFPLIVVSPVNPGRGRWNTDFLNSLLDDVLDKYAVDENRVYLTGHSNGGYGTWSWAFKNPERFAAIAPISGCSNSNDLAMSWKLRHIPIWIFHGDTDEIVDVNCNKVAFEELRQVSQKVKFTIYPNTGHNTWEQPFVKDSVYVWMLKQRKDKNIPKAIKLEKNTAQKYLGEYAYKEDNVYEADTLTLYYENDQLHSKFHNGDVVSIIAESETSFYIESIPNIGMVFIIKDDRVEGFNLLKDKKIFARKIN